MHEEDDLMRRLKAEERAERVSGSPARIGIPFKGEGIPIHMIPVARKRAPGDCGECAPCESFDYNSDKPETHCIDCNCLMCIPGG